MVEKFSFSYLQIYYLTSQCIPVDNRHRLAESPLIAYRRQKIKSYFNITAKVPPNKQNCQKMNINGMRKCQTSCVICPYVKYENYVNKQNFKQFIYRPLSFETENNVYKIKFNTDICKQKYIGESERSMKDRFSEHIVYIKTSKTDETTDGQFNSPGHRLADMTATVLKK